MGQFGEHFSWFYNYRAVTELSFEHITIKNWAYSWVFGVSRIKVRRQKWPPPHPNHFLKTIGNPFFGTPFFGTKRSKNGENLNRKYIALYLKTAFAFDPGPREVPEQENTMIYANTRVCVFSGSGASQGLGSNSKAVF